MIRQVSLGASFTIGRNLKTSGHTSFPDLMMFLRRKLTLFFEVRLSDSPYIRVGRNLLYYRTKSGFVVKFAFIPHLLREVGEFSLTSVKHSCKENHKPDGFVETHCATPQTPPPPNSRHRPTTSEKSY